MVENSEHEVLNIKINDKKTDRKLCKLDFSLCELLKQPDLCLDQQLSLDCPGFTSKLTIALSLKV